MVSDDVEKISKIIFWISLILIIILSFFFTITNSDKESEYYNAWASVENNPAYCENIKTFQDSSKCYKEFVEKGFSCASLGEKSDACLLAEAVVYENELACDVIFLEYSIPLNLECRVSVFIERYTHEGLSDCCHIK